MNISIKEILTGSPKAEMMAHMANNPSTIKELMTLAVTDKQPYAWRAAWLLSSFMEENDTRVLHLIPAILETIPTAPDGQKRDLINVLRKLDIPEDYDGHVFDLCTDLWCNLSKIPSVRCNAFKLMLQIADKYPELLPEVLSLSDKHYLEPLSPGIRNSVKKLIKEVRKAI